MPPVTRSSAAAARDRRQAKSGEARTTRSTRHTRPLTVTVRSPRFSRPRRLSVVHGERPRRSSRLTSGLIDNHDDPDPRDEAAITSPSRPVPGPSGRLPPTSDTRARRLTRQEAFTRLLPNYARDQRRAEARAASKRRRRSTRGRPRRASLFGAHQTRRWFRRSAAGLRVTAEALREVDRAMERFEALVLGWLRQVMAPRRTASLADVLAVLRRSGVAGTAAELRRQIRRYLPLERQQELIRVAESGRLYPAEDPLADGIQLAGW